MRARKKLDFGVSDNDKNINIYRIYGLLITVSSTHSTQIVWQRNNMGSNSNHIDLISSLADQWSATTIGFYEQIFLLLFFFFCSWLTIRRCCGVVTINLIAHRSNMLGDMNRLNVSFDLISARSFFHHPIEWIATVYVVDRAFGRKKNAFSRLPTKNRDMNLLSKQ